MGVTNAAGPGPADLAVPESLDAAELLRRLRRRRMGRRPAPPRGLRQQPPAGQRQLRIRHQLQHLPGLDPAVGRTADPRGIPRTTSKTPSATSPGSASTPRTPPSERSRTRWRPRAALASYPRVGWDGVLAGRAAGGHGRRRAAGRRIRRPAGGRSGQRPAPRAAAAARRVPAGKLWVHCSSGYRAGTAASLLQRAGRDVVHIDAKFDDADGRNPGGHAPVPAPPA